jgi:hypothetical protein
MPSRSAYGKFSYPLWAEQQYLWLCPHRNLGFNSTRSILRRTSADASSPDGIPLEPCPFRDCPDQISHRVHCDSNEPQPQLTLSSHIKIIDFPAKITPEATLRAHLNVKRVQALLLDADFSLCPHINIHDIGIASLFDLHCLNKTHHHSTSSDNSDPPPCGCGSSPSHATMHRRHNHIICSRCIARVGKSMHVRFDTKEHTDPKTGQRRLSLNLAYTRPLGALTSPDDATWNIYTLTKDEIEEHNLNWRFWQIWK